MTQKNADTLDPQEQKTPSPKRRMDALAWILMGASIVLAVVFIPLMIMGVISVPLALGIVFSILGVIHILNSTIRLKVPRFRNMDKRYTRQNLITFLVMGILLLVIGVIHLIFAIISWNISGERLW